MGLGVPNRELRLCSAGVLTIPNSHQGSRRRNSHLNRLEIEVPSLLPRLLNHCYPCTLTASPDCLVFGCCVGNLDPDEGCGNSGVEEAEVSESNPAALVWGQSTGRQAALQSPGRLSPGARSRCWVPSALYARYPGHLSAS